MSHFRAVAVEPVCQPHIGEYGRDKEVLEVTEIGAGSQHCSEVLNQSV